MALSKNFVWVEINRDHTPGIPKKFYVSAYPSLIVLGAKREKVYRFQAYMKPKEFLGHLEEGLRRYALYKKGEEWDTPDPRPARIYNEGTLATFKAPSDKVPSGMAFLNGDLWVGQSGKLFKLDAGSGKIKKTFEMNNSIRGLCADGKFLYGAEYGWTAGKPIHVIDPATGKTIRTIVTAANAANKSYGTSGIACVKDRLYVLEGWSGKIHDVDPQTGEIHRSIQPTVKLIGSLGFDGEHFIAGTRTELLLLNPETGEVVRKTPLNYPVRAVGFSQGSYYLMEQPIFGFDKHNKPTQIWPRETLIYKLKLPPPA